MLQQAEFFAERLKSEDRSDAAKQIERAFELAFARPPTRAERDAAGTLIAEHGLTAFCRAIFNANEFLFIE